MSIRQKTLLDGTSRYRKPTRRDQFLAEMDQVIPWSDLCDMIEPFYPKPEGAGRPPIGIERMLRIHFLQHWFNLPDPAILVRPLTAADGLEMRNDHQIARGNTESNP